MQDRTNSIEIPCTDIPRSETGSSDDRLAERRWRARTRRTTGNRSSATPANRSTNGRANGMYSDDVIRRTRGRRRLCKATQLRAREGAYSRHYTGRVHLNVVGAQSRELHNDMALLAPTEKTCQQMHSRMATPSLEPSSDGTAGGRREDPDKKHGKLSARAMDLSTELLHELPPVSAASTDGAPANVIKVRPRNDTRPRNGIATKASARGGGAIEPRTGRRYPIYTQVKRN
jgi:hypothetical protein